LNGWQIYHLLMRFLDHLLILISTVAFGNNCLSLFGFIDVYCFVTGLVRSYLKSPSSKLGRPYTIKCLAVSPATACLHAGAGLDMSELGIVGAVASFNNMTGTCQNQIQSRCILRWVYTMREIVLFTVLEVSMLTEHA
jgi:hypothetical protein